MKDQDESNPVRPNLRTCIVSAIGIKYFATSWAYALAAERCSRDVAACNRSRGLVCGLGAQQSQILCLWERKER